MSDIGATESGRWQLWQLRWRIGAMSFVNVTARAGSAAPAGALGQMRHATVNSSSVVPAGRRTFFIGQPLWPELYRRPRESRRPWDSASGTPEQTCHNPGIPVPHVGQTPAALSAMPDTPPAREPS